MNCLEASTHRLDANYLTGVPVPRYVLLGLCIGDDKVTVKHLLTFVFLLLHTTITAFEESLTLDRTSIVISIS